MARLIETDKVLSQLVRVRGSIIDLDNARHAHPNTWAAVKRKLVRNVDALEDMLAPAIIDGGAASASARDYVEMIARQHGLKVIECEDHGQLL